MAKVRRGMTPREVVDILGPPLDFSDDTTDPLPGRRAKRAWWLYVDWPKAGVEITVGFTNDQVTLYAERSWDPSGGDVHWDDWAQELMVDHVARMEREFPDQRLAEQPGWYRLTSDEALDFVASTPAGVAGPGRIGRAARRFDDLDVIVSKFDVIDPAVIRTYLPDGYLPTLTRLVNGFGITPGEIDLAHWLLGQAPDGATVAHLAYVPAAPDVTTMAPSELLAPGER